MNTNITKSFILYFITIIFTSIHLITFDFLVNTNLSLPLFELMIIYYFTIYKHNTFGLLFIALIGLWSDALSGSPLGFSSIIYISIIKIYHIVNHKFVAKENFIEIIIEFTIFITSIIFLKWLFLSIYYNNTHNFMPFMMKIIISSISYIVIHNILNFLTNKLETD